MARQSSAVEFNNFVAGLITEASPLNFPDNASLDESNFVLLRDGTRRRRLGIDFETGHAEASCSASASSDQNTAFQTYRWRNAGGVVGKDLIVVQVGQQLKVFDATAEIISRAEVFSKVITAAQASTSFSFATVDGILVVATGSPELLSVSYTSTGAFQESSYRLKIRDLFGVEDVFEGKDTTVGTGLQVRPSTLTQNHRYNLRNQTWGQTRMTWSGGSTSTVDPIGQFDSLGRYPSNADAVTPFLYARTDSDSNPSAQRFDADSCYKNSPPSMPAPKGFFIIDALSRGSSRIEEYGSLLKNYPTLKYSLSSLPQDTTPGGASVVAEYAGRVWYAGFSGDVIGGDSKSPKLSSYLMFSKLIDNPSELGLCYQQGDPTDKEDPDIVETDGGFIRIDGASGIKALVNVGTTLIVLADTGVWTVQGGSDYGFSATNYSVSKISNYGCLSYAAVVQVDSSVMFWGEDGIYVVEKNQFGDWVSESMSHKTIQSMYEDIPAIDKRYADGVYDSYERKVYWTYGTILAGASNVKQLVFDITLGAFYKNDFKFVDARLPMLCSGVTTPALKPSTVAEGVTVNGEMVKANGVDVSVEQELQESKLREVVYLTITQVSPFIKFTFSKFYDKTFTDWKSFDGEGVDANSYLLTGWLNGGDTQRGKQVNNLTMHFEQTEDGFMLDSEGDYTPTNQSSCLVSAQWNWANSVASGKWGKEFQAYRLKRHFFVDSVVDDFDDGFLTVTTRNKLRGGGKTLSMLMRTEPKKDCHILGWGIVMSVATSV